MARWQQGLSYGEMAHGGQWLGHPLPDVAYHVGERHERITWRFHQIRCGGELMEEGERLHHCAATLYTKCVSRTSSIWSLRSERPDGSRSRGITIELAGDGSILQCRGFGNRLPYARELDIVRHWAAEFGLNCAGIEFAEPGVVPRPACEMATLQ
jgi:hypothetical protein